MPNKVAAFYARVSTNRQEQEATIESQIAEIEAKIREEGNVLESKFKFQDNGWSGDLMARPALDAMRDAASKKEFDVLYIWDRDRIGRKFYIQELVLEELEEHGIELMDLHGSKAETPEDKILLGFKGLFAEFEKAKITERMRRGKVYKAKQGIYMNLQAPYGYTYVPKSKDEPSYVVINEEEAEIVRKIFKWIADEGLTRRKVIKRLHALKMYPRKRQRDYWGHGPICRLVRNETYIGRAYYNKSFAKVPENPMKDEQYKRIRKSSRGKKPREEWIPQSVPPIIDEDLFYRVQAQLGRNQVFNPRKQKAPYLLTGLVYCDCGRRRTGEGVREHRYYRCTDAIYRYPLPRVCKASGVNAFYLDTLVWRKVTDLVTNPDLIKKQALKWMTKQKKQKELSNFDVISLKQLLKKLEVEEKRYIKAYGSGVLSLDQFKNRMNELKEKRESMQAEVDKITAYKENQMFDLAAIENLDEKVKGVLANFDLEKKRMFVREVLHSVSVGNENKVLVKGVIPVGKEVQNVSFWPSDRNCGFAQCW